MIRHATLLRVDPPGSAFPGDAIAVRSALTPPTSTDLEWLALNGLSATAVAYLPLTSATPAIDAGALLLLRQDGLTSQAWEAVHVSDHVGAVARYRKVYVVPATSP